MDPGEGNETKLERRQLDARQEISLGPGCGVKLTDKLDMVLSVLNSFCSSATSLVQLYAKKVNSQIFEEEAACLYSAYVSFHAVLV